MDYLKGILFLSGIISPIILIIVCIVNKKRYDYINFLEREYVQFIDLLNKSNDEEKNKILKKAQKTSLYKYIKHYQSTTPLVTDMANEYFIGDNKDKKDRT